MSGLTRFWLPNPTAPMPGSVTISWEEWDRLQRREFLVGVCKCGHPWIMHLHLGGRPGTSCDDYTCQARGSRGCKRYRLRRVRSLRRRRTLR